MKDLLAPIRSLKHKVWAYIFDQLFKSFLVNPEAFVDNPVMMNRLVRYWGNASMAAGVDYATYCAKAGLQSNLRVLECGAGLSTLLIAATGKSKGTKIVSFDDHPFWAKKMQDLAQKYKLDNLTVFYAPIGTYGDYDWYQFDRDAMLLKFDLVLCDGPPGETKGGRFGLFPCMISHFHDQTKVILDDYARQGEKDVAIKWEVRFGWSVKQVMGKKPFALLEKA
jgi:hypothetical protein